MRKVTDLVRAGRQHAAMVSGGREVMPGTIWFLNRAEAVELRPHPRSITGRPGRLWLGLATGEEVLLLQDFAVVQFVASDDVGQGADGHFVFVGYAAAGPGGLIQIAQQG